jgi:hypothetical protein
MSFLWERLSTLSIVKVARWRSKTLHPGYTNCNLDTLHKNPIAKYPFTKLNWVMLRFYDTVSSYQTLQSKYGMLPSSATQRRVVCIWTDVSEERIASNFRVKYQQSKKPECRRWLGNTQHIPEDGNNHKYRCDNLKSYRVNTLFSVVR